LLNSRNVTVTVDSEGELTDICADRRGGTTELVGEWSSFEVALLEGIEPASLLNMCVDGDAGYAPTET